MLHPIKQNRSAVTEVRDEDGEKSYASVGCHLCFRDRYNDPIRATNNGKLSLAYLNQIGRCFISHLRRYIQFQEYTTLNAQQNLLQGLRQQLLQVNITAHNRKKKN